MVKEIDETFPGIAENFPGVTKTFPGITETFPKDLFFQRKFLIISVSFTIYLLH